VQPRHILGLVLLIVSPLFLVFCGTEPFNAFHVMLTSFIFGSAVGIFAERLLTKREELNRTRSRS
jgi:hypothetical protein